jgi:hypothetical protein
VRCSRRRRRRRLSRGVVPPLLAGPDLDLDLHLVAAAVSVGAGGRCRRGRWRRLLGRLLTVLLLLRLQVQVGLVWAAEASALLRPRTDRIRESGGRDEARGTENV